MNLLYHIKQAVCERKTTYNFFHMADRLAKIFGTEEDKYCFFVLTTTHHRVNCPFYYKIGACRHGDRCSKQHTKPILSQTIIIHHMYENPPAAIAFAEGNEITLCVRYEGSRGGIEGGDKAF